MTPDFHPLRVIDALLQFVWVTDPNGSVQYVNHRLAEFTGRPPDDLLGWEWRWVIHPEDYPTTIDRWAACIQNLRPYDVQHRIRREDGLYRWFVSRAEPSVDRDGRVAGWVGTSTDIDDARRVGDAAREDRRLVRAFVERGPDGYALVGADRVVRYVSPRLAAFLGRGAGEVVGTDARGWVHRDDWPRLAAVVADLLGRAGEMVMSEARLLHSDGGGRRVRLRATNLFPDPDVRAVAVDVRAATTSPPE
ncbi:MAG TPA: PAS domain-containing protein [Urbifossiella sp.]|jgi:PAS domain S-box-containing protein|nr:PAS domain-containing protein [Urbifossiella sp.]